VLQTGRVHPTLAKYLNWRTARETLEREDRGQPLRQDERTFAEIARAHPEERALVSTAEGTSASDPAAQRALLFLAARAAAAELREDPHLGGRVLVARSTLTREGATQEQVDEYITSLVLEEAFGADEPVDAFDAAYLEGSLSEVPALAKLTREGVEALLGGFVDSAPAGARPAYEAAAGALVDVAWEEGPKPINIEDLEEALRRVGKVLGPRERARGLDALRRWVAALGEAQLISPPRLARLNRALATAAVEPSFGGELN
jgi:hypothetical protein